MSYCTDRKLIGGPYDGARFTVRREADWIEVQSPCRECTLKHFYRVMADEKLHYVGVYLPKKSTRASGF